MTSNASPRLRVARQSLADECIVHLRRVCNNDLSAGQKTKKVLCTVLLSVFVAFFALLLIVLAIPPSGEVDEDDWHAGELHEKTLGFIFFGSLFFIAANRLHYWLRVAWHEFDPDNVRITLRNHLADRSRAVLARSTLANILPPAAATEYPDGYWERYSAGWMSLLEHLPESETLQQIHEDWARVLVASIELTSKVGANYADFRLRQQKGEASAMRGLAVNEAGAQTSGCGNFSLLWDTATAVVDLRNMIKDMKKMMQNTALDRDDSITDCDDMFTGIHPIIVGKLRIMVPLWLILGVGCGIVFAFGSIVWLPIIWFGVWVPAILGALWFFSRQNQTFVHVERALYLERKMRRRMEDYVNHAVEEQHGNESDAAVLWKSLSELRQVMMENSEAAIAIHFATDVLVHGRGATSQLFSAQALEHRRDGTTTDQ